MSTAGTICNEVFPLLPVTGNMLTSGAIHDVPHRGVQSRNERSCNSNSVSAIHGNGNIAGNKLLTATNSHNDQGTADLPIRYPRSYDDRGDWTEVRSLNGAGRSGATKCFWNAWRALAERAHHLRIVRGCRRRRCRLAFRNMIIHFSLVIISNVFNMNMIIAASISWSIAWNYVSKSWHLQLVTRHRNSEWLTVHQATEWADTGIN